MPAFDEEFYRTSQAKNKKANQSALDVLGAKDYPIHPKIAKAREDNMRQNDDDYSPALFIPSWSSDYSGSSCDSSSSFSSDSGSSSSCGGSD